MDAADKKYKKMPDQTISVCTDIPHWRWPDSDCCSDAIEQKTGLLEKQNTVRALHEPFLARQSFDARKCDFLGSTKSNAYYI